MTLNTHHVPLVAETDETASQSRSIELARAGWGLVLLAAPRAVMENVHGVKVDAKSLVVARILGARHLTQAALSGWRPSPEVLAMGVWVDTVHALTALGLAAVDRSRARAGLTGVAAAGIWAGVGYRDLSQRSATSPLHQRRRDRLARIVLGVVPGGPFLLRQVRADRGSPRRSRQPAPLASTSKSVGLLVGDG